MWLYLYRVFSGWTGILLGIEGGIALAERYLGEYVERLLHWKPHIPAQYKIWFAVVVLVVAQGRVYQDTQRDLAQAGKDNDGLHTATNILSQQITVLKDQVIDLTKQIADLKRQLTGKPPANAIRTGLADLIDKGIKIRDRAPDNVGQPPPDVVADWHKWTAEVDRFLRKNLDLADAVTFKSFERGVEGEPLHFVIRNEIGDLEDLLKQLGH